MGAHRRDPLETSRRDDFRQNADQALAPHPVAVDGLKIGPPEDTAKRIPLRWKAEPAHVNARVPVQLAAKPAAALPGFVGLHGA
jgi:hypothetical protein